MNTRSRWMFGVAIASALSVGMAVSTPRKADPRTPAELVAAYHSLADAILAVKATESNMVRSILGSTWSQAERTFHQAMNTMDRGEDAKAHIESLAALVAQLGNEGDTAVAGIRKRLLEGGHHHNAAGEQQGIFDEGFVIVTRKAKEAFLNSARRIGANASTGDAAALKAEWSQVLATWKTLQGKS